MLSIGAYTNVLMNISTAGVIHTIHNMDPALLEIY